MWKIFWAMTAPWWKVTRKQLWRKLVVSVQNRFNTSQFNMNFISSETAKQFWSVKFKNGVSIYRCYEPTTRKCSHLDWINLYQNDLYPNVFVLKWLEITVNQWPSFPLFLSSLKQPLSKINTLWIKALTWSCSNKWLYITWSLMGLAFYEIINKQRNAAYDRDRKGCDWNSTHSGHSKTDQPRNGAVVWGHF